VVEEGVVVVVSGGTASVVEVVSVAPSPHAPDTSNNPIRGMRRRNICCLLVSFTVFLSSALGTRRMTLMLGVA
jgi:hypothetical protein